MNVENEARRRVAYFGNANVVFFGKLLNLGFSKVASKRRSWVARLSKWDEERSPIRSCCQMIVSHSATVYVLGTCFARGQLAKPTTAMARSEPTLYHLIMVGDGGVGKSALTLQFMYGEVSHVWSHRVWVVVKYSVSE